MDTIPVSLTHKAVGFERQPNIVQMMKAQIQHILLLLLFSQFDLILDQFY